METKPEFTCKWSWLFEDYMSVRLVLGEELKPPLRDELISEIGAVVGASKSEAEIGAGVRLAVSRHDGLHLEYAAGKDNDHSDLLRLHIDIGFHGRRR
jgi:hypothetical protein